MENAAQDPSVEATKIAQPKKGLPILDPGALILIFLNLLFLGGLISLAFLYYQGNTQKLLQESISVTNQSDASLQPSQETTGPDLSLYTVNVLNGSGRAGAATKVANLLKEAGFQKVDKGDAQKSTYQETEVSLKKEVPTTVSDKIKESLQDYSLKFLDPLENEAKYDIEIIVGFK